MQARCFDFISYLRGKTSVADGTLERPFFSVTSVVDLQGGIAGKRLKAKIARCVSSD